MSGKAFHLPDRHQLAGFCSAGHEPHPPHEHPVMLGLTVPGLTLANPFGEAFYSALLSPVQRLALLDRRIEIAVIAQSITPEPPDQPPRPAA